MMVMKNPRSGRNELWCFFVLYEGDIRSSEMTCRWTCLYATSQRSMIAEDKR
jgi:hypothetical protein